VHGIYSNTVPDPEGIAGGSWYWYARHVKLAADPANGIREVWHRDDLRKLGADPRASFGIDLRDGFYSGGGHDALITTVPSRGGHGFAPTRPELHASLIMRGPDLPRAGSLGIVRMTQVGPTLARLFAVSLSPEADEPLRIPATNR
jgi:hypothetical protein